MFRDFGYSRKVVDAMIKQVSDAFMRFRYFFEVKGASEISAEEEHFLKAFWEVVYDLSFEAQKDFMNNDV
jgi:hypothetical protein